MNLPFEPTEYQSRLHGVQVGMEERGIGVLLVTSPENLYYLTGFETTGYYMYQAVAVPAEGEPSMIVRNLEGTLLSATAWRSPGALYADYEDPAEVTARVIRDLGGDTATVGIEEDSFFTPIKFVRRLGTYLPQGSLVDGSGIVESLRMIKSEREIQYIREAAQIATVGMQKAIEAISPGRTENEVAAAIYAGLLPAGSEYPGSHPYVASGPRSGRGHATWSGRIIDSGDIVFLEIGANRRRYGGAHMRAVSVGTPDPEASRRAEAVAAALDQAIQTIRPGISSAEVDAACRSTIEQAGHGPYFRNRTGYSIGLGFPPGWGEGHIFDLKPHDERILERNMTFHLVPNLTDPDRFGIGMSETVRVTDNGCEVLSMPEYGRQLIVV